MIINKAPCKNPQVTEDINAHLPTPACYDTVTCNNVSSDLPKLDALNLGSSWDLDEYFNLKMVRDDTVTHQDENRSPVYQQYTRIKGLRVQVLSPLNPSIDPETQIATVDGESLFPVHVKPVIGDVLIKKMGVKSYFFRVTSVVANTFIPGSGYKVSYQLSGEVDKVGTHYQDLMNKTNTVLHYDQALASKGFNPLVDQATFKERANIRPYIVSATNDYFKRFVDSTTGYLLLQKDGKGVYDPFITDFMIRTTSLGHQKSRYDIRVIPIHKRHRTKYNILDIMLNRSLLMTEHPCRKYCLIGKSSFKERMGVISPSTATFGYMVSAIDTSSLQGKVLKRSDCPHKTPHQSPCMALDEAFCGCEGDGTTDVDKAYNRTVTVDNEQVRTIKSPVDDPNYIFSESFYTKVGEMTLLERLTWKYLENKDISISSLKLLWEDYKNWCSLSRFYFTGILIQLSKYAIEKHKC